MSTSDYSNTKSIMMHRVLKRMCMVIEAKHFRCTLFIPSFILVTTATEIAIQTLV